MKYLVITANGAWGKGSTFIDACNNALVKSKFQEAIVYMTKEDSIDMKCDNYGRMVLNLNNEKWRMDKCNPIVDLSGEVKIVKGEVIFKVYDEK
jgi:hypothetical protein